MVSSENLLDMAKFLGAGISMGMAAIGASIGIGQAGALARGIQLALITTATGLCIGIPALVGFNYFTNKVEGLVLDLEYYAGVLLNKLHSFQQTQPSFSPVQKEAE